MYLSFCDSVKNSKKSKLFFHFWKGFKTVNVYST